MPGARPGHYLVDGVRVTARVPGLGSALLLIGAGAALLLPTTSLPSSRSSVVTLSEELQLHPEQSTDAFVFHHPEAKYFSV